MATSSTFSLPQPKSVLVVGGGPTGLVSLRNLTERGQFAKVELVERRDDVGGVWYLDDAHTPTNGRPRWPSPAYPGLIGNVLPEFLSFSRDPFPPPTSATRPFPTLVETYAYLRAFAEPYLSQGKIRLNTEVIGVEELVDGGWKVIFKDWTDGGKGQTKDERWDAVVLATCWYDHPVWPDTVGVQEGVEKGLIKHSKCWRGPKGYEGKRVVVVGNGNSANDVVTQLSSVAQAPVYRCLRHHGYTNFPFVPHENIVEIGPVARYNIVSTPAGDKLNLLLQDGSNIDHIDTVFVGTGYGFAAPFVRVLSKPHSERKLMPLTPPHLKQSRIPSLHRQIIYAPNPTLAFIGLVVSFTPFIVADVASTWLTLAWSGLLPYPATIAERLEEERAKLEALNKLREETENPSSFMAYHVLHPRETEYVRGLREDIVRVRESFNDVLPKWRDDDVERREAMYALKLEALKLARAEGRDGITVEE